MRKLGICLLLAGGLLLASLLPRAIDWQHAQSEGRAVLERRARGRLAVRPLPGSVIARIAAPAVGVDVVALEGVDAATLELGAGHFPGTALPGEPGNASFAGHRDVEFRGLRRIRPGHEVYVDSGVTTFVYRVTETRIVAPEETSVLADRGGADLTLVTCYPFDWVGPAPQRFVVYAALGADLESGDAVPPSTQTPPRELGGAP
jgi:LPXTG-site transpeptidase (sortase) family protein